MLVRVDFHYSAPLRMEVRLAIPLLDRLEPHHEVLPIRTKGSSSR